MVDLYTHVRQHEPNTITLPQHLKDSGWNTAFHGKVFHHGQNDGSRSWSRQHGPDWAYGQYMTSGRGVPVGNHFNLLHERGHDVNPRGFNYTDHALASLAIHTMRRLNAAPEPWFLAVGFIRPHLPFIAPAPFYDRFLQNRTATVPAPPRVTAPRGASDLTAKSVEGEGLTEYRATTGTEGPFTGTRRGAAKVLSWPVRMRPASRGWTRRWDGWFDSSTARERAARRSSR